jgi:hypothetical protein
MTAPAPLGQNVINNHIAKRAPSRHDGALPPPCLGPEGQKTDTLTLLRLTF